MAEDKLIVEGDLSELKPGEGVVVDGTKYEYGADLNTPTQQLVDTEEGKTISIRTFEFRMNPQTFKIFPTDKQQIFNSHAHQIKTILWADGLIPLEDVSPRVIVDKKHYKYFIFVPSQARANTLFIEKPKNLNEQLTKQNGSL